MKSSRLLLATLAILLFPLLCSGISPKLASDLRGLDPNSAVTVIVQYATPPGAAQLTKAIGRGAVNQQALGLIKSTVYSIPASALRTMADEIGRASCRERE